MSSPVRMCVACRGRFPQESLLRLQYHDRLQVFKGKGRSFYVCKSCQSIPNLSDSIIKVCKLDKKHKENSLPVIMKKNPNKLQTI